MSDTWKLVTIIVWAVIAGFLIFRPLFAIMNVTVDGKYCNEVTIGLFNTAYSDCTREGK